ncbi:MAG: hypothetical protein QOF62_878 [Pyrinomonadaceae bacterium]|jgi:hypothetical protein|nr:hypothetical protein [Pyrinomonadaceae bacterium]
MKNTLDFSEIRDWKHFEDLLLAYFELLKIEEKDIVDVEVRPSGVGSDGGRDLLVIFRVNDGVVSFNRRWVVQGKFQEANVLQRDLSSVNIPSLIHQYGADGYLLVCKGSVSGGVTKMFEGLNAECRFKYKYQIWQGEQFKRRLLTKFSLHAQFFPKYHEFTELKNRRLEP